jgi:hypothetical protein
MQAAPMQAAPRPVVAAPEPAAPIDSPERGDPPSVESAAAEVNEQPTDGGADAQPVIGHAESFRGAPRHRENAYGYGHASSDPDERPAGDVALSNGSTCTAPQLRRFIKSRAYVPMHELRRRFGINGGEDDVTRVELDGEQIYVGLPGHEGRLLGELLRGGEVGYELSLDPRSPVVVGVYPMRPVPRP